MRTNDIVALQVSYSDLIRCNSRSHFQVKITQYNMETKRYNTTNHQDHQVHIAEINL